jgi:hypothetical protein
MREFTLSKKLILLSEKSMWRIRSCGHEFCWKCNKELHARDLVMRSTGKAGKVKYYHESCFLEY